MPTKKATIFPQISQEANALLVQVCEAQGCLPGAVVEAALLALLDPREVTDRDRLLIQGQIQLQEDVRAMLSFHKKILALLEAEQSAPAEVASFADLYPDDEEEVRDEPVSVPAVVEAPQSGGWRKLFSKREKA